MITIPDIYRPSPKYPVYPPYHTGLYLEDHFFEYSKDVEYPRTYIPIFWTTIYCDQLPINIQGILDRYPKDGKYFTVCQHDDAPRERLPLDTLVFSAGGNVINDQTIPIPLVCSAIPDADTTKPKDYFCSFVGSSTHPIREHLIRKYSTNPKFSFITGKWNAQVSEDNYNIFKNITQRSRFTLCPRGYGRTSFRLYECMQLGSVPVYVSDYHYLPYTDRINWNDIAVIVKPNEIEYLQDILENVSDEKWQFMRDKITRLYDQYFSLEGVCMQIHRMVIEK